MKFFPAPFRFRAILTLFACWTTGVLAQPLLLHLPLDGTLDYSGNTGEPQLFVPGDGSAPTFVPGKHGQALMFDGEAAIAMPFNLDHAQYPQVTVTAWVREEEGARGSRDVFNSGSTAGVKLGVHGGRVVTRVGGRGVSYGHGTLPQGEWVFIAAVVDTQSGSAVLYQNGETSTATGLDASTKPPREFDNPDDPSAPPQTWVLVGASSLASFSTSDRPLVIDDVRVYAAALSGDEIAAIREPGPRSGPATTDTAVQVPEPASEAAPVMPGPNAPVGATAGGSIAQSNHLPDGCSSHEDCESGHYCAIEGICHPDRHAPMGNIEIQTVDVPLTTLPQAETTGEPGQTVADRGPPRPVGGRSVSEVSGTWSKTSAALDLEDRFIDAISWSEAGDRPCQMTIANEQAGNEEDLSLQGCDQNDNIFEQAPSVRLDPVPDRVDDAVDRGVVQIGLCHNDRANQRMKGLRISGLLIRADGSTYPHIDMRDREELSHCREWDETVSCETGSLATGLIAHYTRASGRNEQIVGVQLICRAVGFQ